MSDSEEDSLVIVEEKGSQGSPRRKLKRPIPEFPESPSSSVLDKTIQNTIERCQSITPEVAKKIVMKLCKVSRIHLIDSSAQRNFNFSRTNTFWRCLLSKLRQQK